LQPDSTVVSGVLERAGVTASFEEVAPLGAVCRIPAGSAGVALAALRDSDLAMKYLVDLFGIDTGEHIDVVYRVRSFARDEDLVIKSAHDYDAVLASVWEVFPAVLMPERELCELFGLGLAGHPNPKRLLTTDGCPPFLRKSLPIRGADEVRARAEQVVDMENLARTVGSLEARPAPPTSPASPPTEEGMIAPGAFQPPSLPAGLTRAPAGVDHVSTEHLVLSMGPQHPSTHGVLRIQLEIDGEEVVTGETIVGHLHRGIEKLAESRRYSAVGTLMDRGDYVSGIHGELAFALATEQLMEIEVPPRAHWLRCLLGEINRIGSHITWYGPSGLDAGMMGLFLYMFRDREVVLDILEDITGQRMMFNYVRPGGVLADITTTAEAKIRKFLDDFAVHMEENEEMLLDNEIYQARTQGVGVLGRETALAFGLSGGNARASGFDWDLRRDRPYAAYGELDFDVPLAEAGDVYSRIVVRVEEMRQSARMIRQCLDGLPEGDFTAKVPKVLRPPAGESYAAVESPRGELGIHLVSDGGPSPYRMRYRPPAQYALQAGETLLPGSFIADVVVIMGSMDIVLGEIDR
jgi:NADH-quinone oxidoreductase subunit D